MTDQITLEDVWQFLDEANAYEIREVLGEALMCAEVEVRGWQDKLMADIDKRGITPDLAYNGRVIGDSDAALKTLDDALEALPYPFWQEAHATSLRAKAS